MRVTFVALNYQPSTGGAQELVRQVAEGLVRRGHEVEVLTTDALRSPSAREPGTIGVPHEVLGGVSVRRHRTARPVAVALRAARLLSGRLRARRPADRAPSGWLVGPWSVGLLAAVARARRTSDVVVACSAPFTTLMAPTWLRRSGSSAIVGLPLLHVAARAPHRSVGRALRRCDLVVTLTDHERTAAEAEGVDPARTAVVPAGTDPAGFPAVAAPEARRRLGIPERPTVGFVGRLAAYKGVDTLLQAAPLLWERHPEANVVVAGQPSGWHGYRDDDLAALAGDRLVVRESFPASERHLLLSACDVVVHPSREESFGMVAVEAWAARRPIVAADIASVASFVAPDQGELVPVGDAGALAAVLGALLDDPERARAMGEAGRRDVEGRYDWDLIVDAWAVALAELVGRGR